MAARAQVPAEFSDPVRERSLGLLARQLVLESRVNCLGEPGPLQPGDLTRETIGLGFLMWNAMV